MRRKIPITIGIAAYNEEQNIARLLQSLLDQKLTTVRIAKILIISSGSTDKTNKIIKTYASKSKKIKYFFQRKRLGKASAVNHILAKSKTDIIVLTSADILLAKNTLERLITPLRRKNVGIVGSRPIPLNDPKTFCGFAAHLLWNLHHAISLTYPKMGECIAFRKIFKRIPETSSVDETNIESLIHGQGYSAVYEPRAVIYNMGAQNVKEFIARRRHIYAGHLVTFHKYKYAVSTINGTRIFLLLMREFRLSWRFLFWTPLVIALEICSRLLGYMDYTFGTRKHTVWYVTQSTKKLPEQEMLNGLTPGKTLGIKKN